MNWNDYRLIPNISMTFEEKLYTIIKLFLFIGIISALIFNDSRFILFIIILLFIFYIIYLYNINNKINTEKFLDDNSLAIIDNKLCTKPNINNPFMNPSVVDFGNNLKSSCSIDNEKIKNQINDLFKKRIFKDVNDIYNRTISDRQFYTIVDNDQNIFADWLYRRPLTCKENNGVQCYNNIM